MTPEEKHLIGTDPVLKDVITTVPSPSYKSTNNIFHDLMSCVLEQQIHYRSTKKVFQKMLDQSGLILLTPSNFPTFEETAFEHTKLSEKKYETVLNIIQHWDKHLVNWETLSDEEVKLELSKIKGIGSWTIEMILIYSLERPNVFSYDDFHIKQIMTTLFGLNPKSKLKAQMKEVSEAWSPFKSTAFLYLLEWKQFNKTKHKK